MMFFKKLHGVKYSSVLVGLVILIITNEASSKTFSRSISPDSGAHFYTVSDAVLTNECKTYVSAYSNIYLTESKPKAMGITLSIRNIDLQHPIIVNRIDYYDSAGKKIDTLIDQPYSLDPQATVSFVIDQRDMEGGSGASFMVSWGSEDESETPLIEAVMAAESGNKGMAFLSRGVLLSNCGEK